MEFIVKTNVFFNDIVWGVPAMVLILGTGILLSIVCGFPQFVKFGYILRNTIGAPRRKTVVGVGAVSPVKAMFTALAASIGTGNIAGVSGAIALGGPGAVFWMWISALFGMCTKFVEVTLSVKYRERNAAGDWVGGPMYYIRNGLGESWNWLGVLFAALGALAAFGTGNMTQVNTIASTVNTAISSIKPTTESQQSTIALTIGVLVAVIVFFVLAGGTRRIGNVCSILVPCMAAIYVAASLVVIAINIKAVPAAFEAIVVGAFRPSAVAGGLAGVGIKTALTKGVGRGIFSNEAGLGSAPIAHAAADVEHPVRQGIYGVLEVFLDTIVVCTMTAMVVLLGVGVENIEYGNDIAANLTIYGFSSVFGGALSGILVAVCLTLFALTTIFAWGLYGGRCCEFLFGATAAKLYQVIFSLFLVIGSTMELKTVWSIADTLNGMMSIPNLIALIALSPVVVKLCREYFKNEES